MNWQRGDLVLCRVPMPSTQLKEFKIRPAVIVSANSLNQNQMFNDVMIVPCTSNTRRPLTATQYLITAAEAASIGLKVESVVRGESIFTLNQAMVLRKLGCLSAEALSRVNRCLLVALSL